MTTERVATPTRNACVMLFNAGWTIEQVKAWLKTINRDSGYVFLDEIPTTGSIA